MIRIKGLELSEAYFYKYGLPMIETQFPEYQNRIAAGLVGDGSECFGFDDELSRDHDWGPAFCLWLTEQDFEAIGLELQKAYDSLPKSFAGFPARIESKWGNGRIGVLEIKQFYKRFIGFDHPPSTLAEWRVIPEEYLAVATNGKVFQDPYGEFSSFRAKLKAFYPEDIRLKKIAARCMTMAQAGQYNFPRCWKRGEQVAAQYAETQFISATISLVFLLNRQYKPFYKWMHRALKNQPILGEPIYQLISNLVSFPEQENKEAILDKKIDLIETICQHVIKELQLQGLSESSSDFLLDHGPVIQTKIQDPKIRALNVWVE